MEDIFSKRRRRLRQLIQINYGDNQSLFARTIDKNATYVHRLLLDPEKDGQKNLGEKMAREIEFKLHLPVNWFDSDAPLPGWRAREPKPGELSYRDSEQKPWSPPGPSYSQWIKTIEQEPAEEPQAPKVKGPGYESYEFIERRNIRLLGDAGMDFMPANEPPLAFHKTWLRNKRVDTKRLATAEIDDESMEPTICAGDTVLIDLSDKELTSGKVYAIRIGTQVQARRVFKRTLVIELRTDNPRFPDEEIAVKDQSQLLFPHIISRVIWRAGDL